MLKRALDHRREERTEEVRDVHNGASAKGADDNEGPGQGQITEEARGAEGEGRSTTTDAVDGAAALGPALVAEKLCWNCGTPGKESNLCTCRGCRKVGQEKKFFANSTYITLNITNFSRPSTATRSAKLRTGRSMGGSAGRRRRGDRGGKRPGNVVVRSTRGVMVLKGRGDWRILRGSTSMKWIEFIISFNRVSF